VAKDDKSSKKVETLRERAEKAAQKSTKSEPAEKALKVKKEKKRRGIGKLSIKRKNTDKVKKTRRFHIIPRFFPEAIEQLKDVTWPDRRNTLKLTLAVIIFSTVFAGLIGGVDSVLGIIFKKAFLHG
jgi:preprotein translocase SecE subunit